MTENTSRSRLKQGHNRWKRNMCRENAWRFVEPDVLIYRAKLLAVGLASCYLHWSLGENLMY